MTWQGPSPPAPAARAPTPLINRAEELAHLDLALARATACQPTTVLFGGEPGVGKSRLVREFGDRAGGAGARVLWGGCVDLGAGDLPYAPLVDALRALTRELGAERVRDLLGAAAPAVARLTPFLGGPLDLPATDNDARARMFEGLLRMFDRLGESGPVVLIFEDLHWADSATLDLLTFVVRSLTRERLLVLGTFRSTDLRPGHPLRSTLVEFDRARRADRWELRGLRIDELGDFVAALLSGDRPPALIQDLFELTDGNPFFVEELVAAGQWSASRVVPKPLRDVVIAQVEVTTEAAQAVLRTAAVAGRHVGHRLLAAATDLPQPDLLAGLRDCVDHHLLVPDADRQSYAFRHALVRETVYAELLPGERMRLHAGLAEALARDPSLAYTPGGAGSAELAHHWHAAGDSGRALVVSVRAGVEAGNVGAFAESEQHFNRALGLWPDGVEAPEEVGLSRAEVLQRAADAARWAGRVDRAVALIRAALADAPADHAGLRAALHERLGSFLWEAGDSDGSLTSYLAADRLLVDEPPSALQARVRAARASAAVRVGDHGPALRLGREAIAIAWRAGARPEEGRALNTVGMSLTMTGSPDDGIAALRSALTIARESDHLEDVHRAYANLTFALENAGRCAEALQTAIEGLDHSRRAGLPFGRGGMLLANAAILLLELGEWDRATEFAADALDHELPLRATVYLRLVLAQIDIGRGRFEAAQERLRTVRTAVPDLRAAHATGPLHACLAEAAIWQSDPGSARRSVLDGLDALSEAQDAAQTYRLGALGLRADADEAQRLLPSGRETEVAEVRARGAGLAERIDRIAGARDADRLVPEAAAYRLLCLAERDRLDGTDDAAVWVRAATAWRRLGWVYQAAYATWRQAETVLSRRDRDRAAVPLLRDAYTAAVDLRAEPLRHEIEVLARRARIDLTGPVATDAGARPARPSRPFGLTPRELEILGYLGAGQSNREIAGTLFISEKTVSVHVSNILVKLKVSRRGEAAAAAHRLGLTADGP